MYDCQIDDCTEFSFAFADIVGSSRPLCGYLVAVPAQDADTLPLTELAAYAARLGLPCEINRTTLTVRDISLADALAINAHFERRLVISCNLRRDPPVRFND